MKVLLVGEGASELCGALETLVRRLGLDEAQIDQDVVKQNGIHLHLGKGKGFFKRAVRWMLEARKRGHDALILVIDEDGHSERSKQLAEAQQYTGTPIRRAFGIAIRTFDAWMLADEKALTKSLDCNVSRQPDPERIVDPKGTFDELLNNAGRSKTRTELYAAIAKVIELELLQQRCSKGFAPFAQRVRELSS